MKKDGKNNSIKKIHRTIEILKSKKDTKKEKLPANIKKISVIIILCLLALSTILYFTITNYPMIKNGFKTTSESIMKILTVDEKKELHEFLGMYVTIKPAEINLLNEENQLKARMEGECSSEKKELENSVKQREMNKCNDEKNALKENYNTQINKLKSDLNSCEEELESLS